MAARLTSSMRCFLGTAACAGLSSLSEAGRDVSLAGAAGAGRALCSFRFFFWGSTASPAEHPKHYCLLAHLMHKVLLPACCSFQGPLCLRLHVWPLSC